MLVVEAAFLFVSCFWTGITAISTDRSVQIPRIDLSIDTLAETGSIRRRDKSLGVSHTGLTTAYDACRHSGRQIADMAVDLEARWVGGASCAQSKRKEYL